MVLIYIKFLRDTKVHVAGVPIMLEADRVYSAELVVKFGGDLVSEVQVRGGIASVNMSSLKETVDFDLSTTSKGLL